jgi:hypothetical protein
MSKQINKEQLEEWTENPITELFRKILIEERDEILAQRGLEAFEPFQPYRTQEVLANLNGFVDAMNIVIDSLSGDWSLWDEEDNE